MARCPIREIAKQAEDAGIPFLVIGGYAVFAHGYVRATDDLDLIVQRGRRAQLGKLLGDLGMIVKNDAANFVQFDPRDESGMEVDLMLVSEDVFGRLEQAAVKTTVEGTEVRVVSLLHLIALKCYSLQHSKSMRRLKDMDDLVQLILINRLDLNQPELRATILKHGNTNSMKSCDTPAATTDDVLRDAPGLEFPDWSGKLPNRSRKTFAEVVRWNDEMLATFPYGKRLSKLEAERRCHAEFIL